MILEAFYFLGYIFVFLLGIAFLRETENDTRKNIIGLLFASLLSWALPLLLILVALYMFIDRIE